MPVLDSALKITLSAVNSSVTLEIIQQNNIIVTKC